MNAECWISCNPSRTQITGSARRRIGGFLCAVFFALSALSVRADSFVWKSSLYLTNGASTNSIPSIQYYSQTGNFQIPTIDSTKFVVTNSIFKLNGVLVGAAWGGESTNIELSASIETAVQVYGFSDSHTVGPSGPYADSVGFSVVYNELPILTYPTNYFLSGSPIDQGGYINVPGQYDIVVNGGLTIEATGDSEPAEIFAFVVPLRLDVELDVVAISTNASVSNLPPSNLFVPVPVNQYDLGSQGLPMPPIAGVPNSVQSMLSLKVNSVTVQSNDVHVLLQTSVGKTNYVQASSGLTGGFTDISGPIVAPGSNQIVSTEFVDTGAATNGAPRFYRVRLAP